MVFYKDPSLFYKVNCGSCKALLLYRSGLRGESFKDLLQDWWLYLLEQKLLSKYNASIGDLDSYMYGCIDNFCLRFCRNRRPQHIFLEGNLEDTEMSNYKSNEIMELITGFSGYLVKNSNNKHLELFNYYNAKGLGLEVSYPSKAVYKSRTGYLKARDRYLKSI
jgi:hypothetical protein